ncbi:hypothetical protein JCM10450v2_003362 [Rhodotorula kratochvilovae]
MRASLDSLPDELLKLIVEGLPHPVTDRRHATQAQRKTLIACFLVSRRVRRIAQPVLWRCISTSRQLALGAGVDWIGTHLRELTVHDSLVPNEITPSGGTYLSTLHFSKVTIDIRGFESMPQLRDLGRSFVLFVNTLTSSVLDPRRLPSLRNIYADRVWQGVATRVSLPHLAFELAPQLESLQIQREGALTAAELKELPPLPVAVVVNAPVNNTPYHRDNTPFAHLEL